MNLIYINYPSRWFNVEPSSVPQLATVEEILNLSYQAGCAIFARMQIGASSASGKGSESDEIDSLICFLADFHALRVSASPDTR